MISLLYYNKWKPDPHKHTKIIFSPIIPNVGIQKIEGKHHTQEGAHDSIFYYSKILKTTSASITGE